MLVDTHAHINTKEFNEDYNQVLQRAIDNDVKKIIVVGMDNYHNLKALELSKNNKNIYASIGIHPVDCVNESLDDLEKLLEENKVTAIGETGIDLYWQKDTLDLQIHYFKRQIELAIKYNLPIIVHTRESFNEAYEVIKPYKGQIKGVFHAFSSSYEDALKVIDLGLYIGISGVVTFKKALELQDLVSKIDLKHVIVETDSPYLAPTPYRGKRNEPSYVLHTAEKIAEIKNISLEEVKKITTNNAIELFGLE